MITIRYPSKFADRQFEVVQIEREDPPKNLKFIFRKLRLIKFVQSCRKTRQPNIPVRLHYVPEDGDVITLSKVR